MACSRSYAVEITGGWMGSTLATYARVDGLDLGYLCVGGWARLWLLLRGRMGSTLATFARAGGDYN